MKGYNPSYQAKTVELNHKKGLFLAPFRVD